MIQYGTRLIWVRVSGHQNTLSGSWWIALALRITRNYNCLFRYQVSTRLFYLFSSFLHFSPLLKANFRLVKHIFFFIFIFIFFLKRVRRMHHVGKRGGWKRNNTLSLLYSPFRTVLFVVTIYKSNTARASRPPAGTHYTVPTSPPSSV